MDRLRIVDLGGPRKEIGVLSLHVSYFVARIIYPESFHIFFLLFYVVSQIETIRFLHSRPYVSFDSFHHILQLD